MAALLEVSFNAYDMSNKDKARLKELPIEDYERLRKIFPNNDATLPEDQSAINTEGYWYLPDTILDEIALEWLVELGFKMTIKRWKCTYQLPERIKDPKKVVDGQQITHIHIPNIGLLMIDDVTWLEDACTQELQTMLDSGWRILAICPPNGVRRPDYILGRTKDKS